MLNIPNFPHAHYDPETRTGYLCLYYPSNSIDKSLWRYESYSAEILNYKEGQEAHIQFFVDPFLQLIEYALAVEWATRATLVPAPSSTKFDAPEFSRVPMQKSSANKRNRDDRNLVFCNQLSLKNNNLQTLEIIRRSKGKPRKAAWNAATHAASVQVKPGQARINKDTPTIVVDDVITNGGTMDGMRIVIQKAYPETTIIRLALAKTAAPADFQALTQRKPKLNNLPDF